MCKGSSPACLLCWIESCLTLDLFPKQSQSAALSEADREGLADMDDIEEVGGETFLEVLPTVEEEEEGDEEAPLSVKEEGEKDVPPNVEKGAGEVETAPAPNDISSAAPVPMTSPDANSERAVSKVVPSPSESRRLKLLSESKRAFTPQSPESRKQKASSPEVRRAPAAVTHASESRRPQKASLPLSPGARRKAPKSIGAIAAPPAEASASPGVVKGFDAKLEEAGVHLKAHELADGVMPTLASNNGGDVGELSQSLVPAKSPPHQPQVPPLHTQRSRPAMSHRLSSRRNAHSLDAVFPMLSCKFHLCLP